MSFFILSSATVKDMEANLKGIVVVVIEMSYS